MKLIGLKGQIGSGKTTASIYLEEKHGFKCIALADCLKEFVALITGWPLSFVSGNDPTLRNDRETLVHPHFNMTCRQLLQYIGTEIFRHKISNTFWIDVLKRRIEGKEPQRKYSNHGNLLHNCLILLLNDEKHYINPLAVIITNIMREKWWDVWTGSMILNRVEFSTHYSELSRAPGIIITDIRFKNEADEFKDITILRLVRDNTTHNVSKSVVNHESETLTDTDGEYIIENNGTIEELYAKLDNLIK